MDQTARSVGQAEKAVEQPARPPGEQSSRENASSAQLAGAHQIVTFSPVKKPREEKTRGWNFQVYHDELMHSYIAGERGLRGPARQRKMDFIARGSYAVAAYGDVPGTRNARYELGLDSLLRLDRRTGLLTGELISAFASNVQNPKPWVKLLDTNFLTHVRRLMTMVFDDDSECRDMCETLGADNEGECPLDGFDKLVILCNDEHGHFWFVLEVSLRNKTMVAWDSLKRRDSGMCSLHRRCCMAVEWWLTQLDPAYGVDWERQVENKVPQQTNTADGGLFALSIAEHLLTGRPIVTVTGIPLLRAELEYRFIGALYDYQP